MKKDKLNLQKWLEDEIKFQELSANYYKKLEKKNPEYKQVTSMSMIHFQKAASLKRVLSKIIKKED